jgi:hypothetical protein
MHQPAPNVQPVLWYQLLCLLRSWLFFRLEDEGSELPRLECAMNRQRFGLGRQSR